MVASGRRRLPGLPRATATVKRNGNDDKTGPQKQKHNNKHCQDHGTTAVLLNTESRVTDSSIITKSSHK